MTILNCIVNFSSKMVYMNINNRFIPSIQEFTERGEKAYDIFSRLLKDRIILLHGPIEENLAVSVCAQMLALEAEHNEKPIYLYVNSPGGVVYDSLMITDTMGHISCKVYTVGTGIVASAAAIIVACGSKGCRMSLPNTRYMIHQPHGGSRGQATDIEIQTKEILFLKESLINTMVARTGKDKTFIKASMERDFYMSAKEAMDTFGFIDKILEIDYDKNHINKKSDDYMDSVPFKPITTIK